jgi:hypothetical protein
MFEEQAGQVGATHHIAQATCCPSRRMDLGPRIDRQPVELLIASLFPENPKPHPSCEPRSKKRASYDARFSEFRAVAYGQTQLPG